MAGESVEITDILKTESYLVSQIVGDWSQWKRAKTGYEKNVAANISYVYATSTRETENGGDWDHSTNIPKLTNIYDNLNANYIEGLLPHEDWFALHGEDQSSLELKKRSKIVAYLKTKHRLKKIREVVKELLNDWVLGGNCFAEVFYVKETHEDPLTGVSEPGYEGPVVRRIDPNDIAFNTIASSFENAPKIIRSVKTLGEVAKEVEERPNDTYLAGVLRRVLENRTSMNAYTVDDISKSTQFVWDGFGSYGEYMKGQYVEFLDFYGDIYDTESQTLHKNTVITVVDRQFVARNEPLKTYSGKPHIFHSSWRKRPNNLWGQGPLDGLVGMQYRLNHLENARADAFDEMLFGDLVFKGDVEMRKGPNGENVYVVPENGDVQRLAPDATVLNADFQIERLEAKMEMFAGAPRDAMGFRTPGEKTKFEVSTLTNAAMRIFQNKMTEFEQTILERILNAEIEVARSNLTGRDVARADNPNTGVAEIMDIKKEDLLYNGRVVPMGARHFARQAQLSQDLLTFQQSALTDEEVKQHFPAKKIAKAWEELLGAGQFELYEPYGRIPERVEAARLNNAAQTAVEEEVETGLGELETDGGTVPPTGEAGEG